MKGLLVGLALLFGTSLGWAQNGNDLRDQCGAALNRESGARAGLCVGFVNGYRQLAAMLPNEKLLCLPSTGVGNEQFIKVVVKYLDQHPQKLHLPAAN